MKIFLLMLEQYNNPPTAIRAFRKKAEQHTIDQQVKLVKMREFISSGK